MSSQILHDGSSTGDIFTRASAQRIQQSMREDLDRTRPHRQPMIRLRSRRRRRTLDHVQPVHVAIGITALGKVANVADVAGESGVEKIRVERDNYIGLSEIVARLNRLAKG